MRHYEPPDVLTDTVFDPEDDTFGPIMAAIQEGEFEEAAILLNAIVLNEDGPALAAEERWLRALRENDGYGHDR